MSARDLQPGDMVEYCNLYGVRIGRIRTVHPRKGCVRIDLPWRPDGRAECVKLEHVRRVI